jgi:hypothetical protein
MLSLPCGEIEAHFAHLSSNFSSSKWTHGSHLLVGWGGINESPGNFQIYEVCVLPGRVSMKMFHGYFDIEGALLSFGTYRRERKICYLIRPESLGIISHLA